MMECKYSVVIPVYNGEKFIKRALLSVLGQKYNNIEVIVIDDGSTDKTTEIVMSVKDERVRLISKENGGVSSARNLGIEKSEGEYIALLDADDYWLPNHLATADLFFKQSKHDIYCSKHVVSSTSVEFNNDTSLAYEIKDYFNEGFKYLNSSHIVFKKTTQELPLFNCDFKYGEDLDCWFRMADRSPTIGVSKTVQGVYWMHSNSVTKKLSDKSHCWDFFYDLSDKYRHRLKTKAANRIFKQYIHAKVSLNKYEELRSYLIKHRKDISWSNLFLLTSVIKLRRFNYLNLVFVSIYLKIARKFS